MQCKHRTFVNFFLILLSGALLSANVFALDTPEVAVGERLFMETRFAQYFFEHTRDMNRELKHGDPVVGGALRAGEAGMRGAFRGKSMNCRVCHLIDEHKTEAGLRSYADFARRSPIPMRADGVLTTLRNSPSQVNSGIERENLVLHFDGEFSSMENLVKGTFTGRNFGWVEGEEEQARTHLANVIRSDSGFYPLSKERGGSYARVFLGTDPRLPKQFQLPEKYRLDVTKATDVEILDLVARLVAAYVNKLKYQKIDKDHIGSPYDAFLRKNKLPEGPNPGESYPDYSRRLLKLVEATKELYFINEQDGKYKYHKQLTYVFGAEELEGFKIFMREPADEKTDAAQGVTGNCIACHAAPHFTDFSFHNTGVSQDEYDSIHGRGEFMKIKIPTLAERSTKAKAAETLPTKPEHPTTGVNPFADIPTKENPGRADLGVWNTFLNPFIPRPQQALRNLLTAQNPDATSDEQLLSRAIAVFKTPVLRDLDDSAPYFHSGRADDLETVLNFYVEYSGLAREGKILNPDRRIGRIHVSAEAQKRVIAFLKALNEDYD